MLMLYHWLARKKSEYFPNFTICEELREQVNIFIENSLKKKGFTGSAIPAPMKLPVHHAHKICDKCFRNKRNNDLWFD